MWEALGLLLWLAFLLLAMPYVRRAKHPDAQLVSAYMVFVILFSVVSVVTYSLLLLLLGGLSAIPMLHHPLGALAFLFMVFAPAFLVARWQIKRPPRKTPRS
jgi:hypothetical protein